MINKQTLIQWAAIVVLAGLLIYKWTDSAGVIEKYARDNQKKLDRIEQDSINYVALQLSKDTALSLVAAMRAGFEIKLRDTLKTNFKYVKAHRDLIALPADSQVGFTKSRLPAQDPYNE